MALPAYRHDTTFNYHDYLNWGPEIHGEIINGTFFDMSPAPSTRHQVVLGELFTQFSVYLRHKTCKVFVAPFDVRFIADSTEDDKIQNVVQPDITIVCDRSKIDKNGCQGSPDLVVEIVSPGTLKKDMKEKWRLYEKFGVQEYWLVYPEENMVYVFTLSKDGKYQRPEIYAEEDIIQVGIFEDLKITLSEIFRE
jgi:Uma2 family endonuclease